MAGKELKTPNPLGIRVLAKVYKAGSPELLGYRFFDETGKGFPTDKGKQRQRIIDVSIRDLMANKKDIYTLISSKCKHAHFTKVGNVLNVSYEDGEEENLPKICIVNVATKEIKVLENGYPACFALKRDANGGITNYAIVMPTGAVQTYSSEELKQFVLVGLHGAQALQAMLQKGIENPTLRMFNLKIQLRNINGKGTTYLNRTNEEYSYPEQ